jgi:hypothetical protein
MRRPSYGLVVHICYAYQLIREIREPREDYWIDLVVATYVARRRHDRATLLPLLYFMDLDFYGRLVERALSNDDPDLMSLCLKYVLASILDDHLQLFSYYTVTVPKHLPTTSNYSVTA